MIRHLACVLLVIVLASASLAQGGSKSVVAVTSLGPANSVPAGSAFQVAVTLHIKPGYHINAQKPSEDYLIGTSLAITPPAGMKVSKISYPSAKMAKLGFSDTPL